VYLNQRDAWSLEREVPVARGGAPQKQGQGKTKVNYADAGGNEVGSEKIK